MTTNSVAESNTRLLSHRFCGAGIWAWLSWVVWKAAIEVLVIAGSSSGGLTGMDLPPDPVRWQDHLCGCRTQVLCSLLGVCQGCSQLQEIAMVLCHVALSSGLLIQLLPSKPSREKVFGMRLLEGQFYIK